MYKRPTCATNDIERINENSIDNILKPYKWHYSIHTFYLIDSNCFGEQSTFTLNDEKHII